eukprot:gene4623-6796_t
MRRNCPAPTTPEGKRDARFRQSDCNRAPCIPCIRSSVNYREFNVPDFITHKQKRRSIPYSMSFSGCCADTSVKTHGHRPFWACNLRMVLHDSEKGKENNDRGVSLYLHMTKSYVKQLGMKLGRDSKRKVYKFTAILPNNIKLHPYRDTSIKRLKPSDQVNVLSYSAALKLST